MLHEATMSLFWKIGHRNWHHCTVAQTRAPSYQLGDLNCHERQFKSPTYINKSINLWSFGEYLCWNQYILATQWCENTSPVSPPQSQSTLTVSLTVSLHSGPCCSCNRSATEYCEWILRVEAGLTKLDSLFVSPGLADVAQIFCWKK